MLRRILPLLGLWALAHSTLAQQADVQQHDETYHFIDRIDIKGLTGRHIATDIKPYAREHVVEYLNAIDTSRLGRRDRHWLARTRFRMDDDAAPEQERGILRYFYTNQRDGFSVRQRGFTLYANAILYLSLGADRARPDSGASRSTGTFRNTRGFSFRGSIFDKVGYYAEVLEQQSRYPFYISDIVTATGAIPGEGYWKPFKVGAYDYFTFRGYLTYSPVKQLRLKFGRDRSFYGQGSQSLLLSDYATDYTLLSASLRVWKLEYTSQWAQMIDFIPNKADALGSQPRKYGAFHLLAFRPNAKLSIGIFESTIFAPNQNNGTGGFDLQYLNPLIFYRAAEQYAGSPNNTTLGLTGKWNLLKRLQLYGQVLVDDLNLGSFSKGAGWWGNKIGFQAGLKWIDVLNVETLDLQAELNTVRPYTYSHFNTGSNYSHYGQYLGHSLGANLRDVNLTLHYQPIPRLYLYARYNYIQQGKNFNGLNFGNDINVADPPVQLYGNTIGQGRATTLHTMYARATYQYRWQPLYIDAELQVRRGDGTQSVTLMAALRYNIPWRPVNF